MKGVCAYNGHLNRSGGIWKGAFGVPLELLTLCVLAACTIPHKRRFCLEAWVAIKLKGEDYHLVKCICD